MSVVKRQSIKSTIYIYAGVLLGFVYTGILMPNFLTKSEIGALNLIVSYSLIFGQLGSLGFHSATVRIFPYFKNSKSGHHGFMFLSILVSFAGFLLVAAFYHLLKPWLIARNIGDSPVFTNYFYLILPVAFFTIFYNQFDAYARGLYFSTVGSFLKEFFQRALILLVIALFILDFIDRDGLFITYSVALCLPTATLVLFLILKKEFRLQPDFQFINKPLVRDMARMGMFGLLTGFGVIAIAQLDRLMINFYLSESETGVYSTAFYFGTLILMPSRAVQRIAASVIAVAFKENDLGTIGAMYKKTCLYQFMLSLLLFLLLWMNVDAVFTIIPEEYVAGKYVIFFIGLANVIAMAGGTSVSIISSSRHYAKSAWFVGIFLVMIILTNIILIPAFGITGAAAASAISTLVYTALQFSFIYFKWKFQPYNFRFLLLIGISVLIYLAVNQVPAITSIYLGILVKSTLIAGLFVASVYWLKISPELNGIMQKYFRAFLHFFKSPS